MAKVALDDISDFTSGSAPAAYSEYNNRIEAAMEKTLSRDGTSPNQMEADLDMNGFRILNLPDATDGAEPVTKRQIDDTADSVKQSGVNPLVTHVRTVGFASVGDGGGALYRKVGSSTKPALAQLTSSNDVLFDLAETSINLAMLGAGRGDAIADTAALKAAIAMADNLVVRSVILLPAADITIEDTIDITYGNFIIRGLGRRASKIISEVIGAPTFRIIGDAVYLGFEDFAMQGNGLAGVTGNGHAFALWKATTSGAAVPQLVSMQRVTIRGFRGDDTEGSLTASAAFASLGAMVACAINLKGALACLVKDVDIQSCGGGIYVAQTQNCALENITASACDVFGLLCYRNAALVVDKGDIQDCNNGMTLTVPVSLPAANILAYRENGTKFLGLKTKNAGGGSQIYEQEGIGTEYIGLWLQTTMTADVPHKGIILSDCSGIQVIGGVISMTVTTFSSQKHLPIEIISTQNSLPVSACIDGVQMLHPPGMNVSTYIRVAGNGGNRLFASLKVGNCVFGNRAAPSSGYTADNGILVELARIVSSEFTNNLFHAAQGVTITNGVRFNSVIQGNGNRIGLNAFIRSGTGTITNEYVGVTPTGGIETLVDGATIAPDVNRSKKFKVTIAGSRTVAVPGNLADNIGSEIEIAVSQGGGGNHLLTWDAVWKWPGGTPPVLTTTPGKTDRFRGLIVSATEIQSETVGLNY